MNALAACRTRLSAWSPRAWSAIIVSSVVLGLVMGSQLDGAFDSAYNWARPVSTARISEVKRVGDELWVHVHVIRHRGECRMTGHYASADMVVGPRQKAYAARVDREPAGDVPVGPEVDVGWWKLWPVGGATRLEMYAYYVCDGKPAGAKLFEVAV
jgi:hypothetical protein